MILAYQHLWDMILRFAAPFALSAVAVAALTPGMIVVARKYNIMDIPNERKIHSKPVPRLGGLALLIGFWVVALINLPWNKEFAAIIAGATIIGVMGIMDDVRSLSSRIRLVGQLIASFLVIWAGLIVSFMPKTWWGQVMAGIITVLWIIGIVNALNFADGLDGLATGMTFIASTFFFLIAIYLGQPHVACVAAMLAGCCLGFLVWNFKPAKIYLGDGGSTFLGFVLACLALYGGWSHDGFIVALGIPTIILGVLIFDMFYITIARIKNGSVTTFQQWLDFTGKDHFHHRLMSLGFSEVMAVVFIYLVCLVLGLNVLMLEKVQSPLAVSILFINALFIFTIIFLLMRVGHGLKGNKQD
ncbi:MAG: undecaprenyl/decaprenyl-phosphate alpha-N-acetylglucosaminyl 1-phosphate transferase [Candidatus Omnitrophica bacterium]|nr:undecaprenyl/decaprenyl-phosphate alpha-N-acetylglucosaminyl 1-phosphate transferase [Candidatus Omnitrophota bacterium]